MQGGFEVEVAPQRDIAGNGPVVRYQIQEDRGLDHDGHRMWYVWTDTEDKADALHSFGCVKGFNVNIADRIRLVKITTEVIDV